MQLPVQNFGSLNTDFVDCRVSGAVDVYRSCEITGRSIVITLDEKLEHTKIMHLHLSNVLNPDEGATQPLYIATYYDNVLVDSTDTVTG